MENKQQTNTKNQNIMTGSGKPHKIHKDQVITTPTTEIETT